MSLKPIKLDSVDARAQRVIVAHGRAPNLLRAMDDSEKASLAALVDEDGNLKENAGDGFREVLVAYNERRKATDASLEGEPVSVHVSEGKSAVVKAAELVADGELPSEPIAAEPPAPTGESVTIKGEPRKAKLTVTKPNTEG